MTGLAFQSDMTETMYSMKPVFDLDAKVDVPGCMYTLPVIQSSNTIPGVGVGVPAGSSPQASVVAALEARQDALLARLDRLKEEVAAYRSSLGLQGTADTPTQVTRGCQNITVSSLLLSLLSLSSLRLTQPRKDSASFGRQSEISKQSLERLQVATQVVQE